MCGTIKKTWRKLGEFFESIIFDNQDEIFTRKLIHIKENIFIQNSDHIIGFMDNPWFDIELKKNKTGAGAGERLLVLFRNCLGNGMQIVAVM